MIAELKQLHSPDEDLRSFTPENSDHFGIFIQALIGPKGMEGEESFGIMVCTPKWFASSEPLRNSYLWTRGYLFVSEYNLDVIQGAIDKLCAQATGDNWAEVANKLSKYSIWEFEDYTVQT